MAELSKSGTFVYFRAKVRYDAARDRFVVNGADPDMKDPGMFWSVPRENQSAGTLRDMMVRMGALDPVTTAESVLDGLTDSQVEAVLAAAQDRLGRA